MKATHPSCEPEAGADVPDPCLRPAWADLDADAPPGPLRRSLPRPAPAHAADAVAASFLAAQGVTIHPLTLALRDAERSGGRALFPGSPAPALMNGTSRD